ncbi:MAG: hypothetical protein JJU33_04205 [Phycisphaerales bacterium]|nr:hypothetical protein [Phycisphaerales bacterium]
MKKILQSSVLCALVGIGAASGAATAQNEFLLYECDATVRGVGMVEARIRAEGGFFAEDRDRVNFGATHSPGLIDPFTFNGGGRMLAEVALRFNQERCITRAWNSVYGETFYNFTGNLHDMRYRIGSGQEHRHEIDRDPSSLGIGGVVVSDTAFFQAPPATIVTEIPFVVGGGNNGVLSVSEFRLDRIDTGPTQGLTSMMWEVYADLNSNCVIDRGDRLIASGFASVGPNESFIDRPTGFRVPRGYYVLRLTYASYASMRVVSDDCRDPVRDESVVRDGVTVHFDLN